jgi:NADH:ubiquinone oxidoreductase subunit H
MMFYDVLMFIKHRPILATVVTVLTVLCLGGFNYLVYVARPHPAPWWGWALMEIGCVIPMTAMVWVLIGLAWIVNRERVDRIKAE